MTNKYEIRYLIVQSPTYCFLLLISMFSTDVPDATTILVDKVCDLNIMARLCAEDKKVFKVKIEGNSLIVCFLFVFSCTLFCWFCV